MKPSGRTEDRAQDKGVVDSAGSRAAHRRPRPQAVPQPTLRAASRGAAQGAAHRHLSSGFLSAVPEHRCGPRGSLTWPEALRRSRYCSSLRKPGPPRRTGAWPVQGTGSERAEEALSYTATPGSPAASSAAKQNIATVLERSSSPGPPRSPAAEL